MKKLILIALFLSSGCSSFRVPEGKPVEVITVELPAPMYHPPLPNQIVPMLVEWRVLTPDTMAVYLSDLEKGEAPSQAYYGLTNKGYENLANNMAEVKRYIRQMLSILQYYRVQDQEPRL